MRIFYFLLVSQVYAASCFLITFGLSPGARGVEAGRQADTNPEMFVSLGLVVLGIAMRMLVPPLSRSGSERWKYAAWAFMGTGVAITIIFSAFYGIQKIVKRPEIAAEYGTIIPHGQSDG